MGFLQEKVAELKKLQQALSSRPYSTLLRLQLATAYKELGYPDLAVGDAYKALLLIDELNEDAEFHDEALTAAKADLETPDTVQITKRIRQVLIESGSSFGHVQTQEVDAPNKDDPFNLAKRDWSQLAYASLVSSLIDSSCLRSAYDYNTRALRTFPEVTIFASYRNVIRGRLHSHFESQGENIQDVDIAEYPDKGSVRRELYPWNTFEPDRFCSDVIENINRDMSAVGPKLEVKVVELPVLSSDTARDSEVSSLKEPVQYVKQLGLFAKEDIMPGELILQEKSILTAVARLHDSYCDACSAPLPSGQDSADTLSCEDCEEVFFCSEECRDLAQDHYHTALCGVNLGQGGSAKDSSESLYSLLLIRALALAEVQDVHPLDLKELRFIWGDYHGLKLEEAFKTNTDGSLDDPFGSIAPSLPFSFHYNILLPLNILEKMDVNIFEQSQKYDTWVFNTLYAKFRGTASARQGPDGRPELGAVHPLWCLANHSCDPNVAWEWNGDIKFWTREHLVEWKGRDPERKSGLCKGDEVLSHYCDVRLPVKERREWAVGTLGGLCMCPRCVWEEAHEKDQ